MKKKLIILGILGVGGAIITLPLFAAFEAHVINVTASVSNALFVHPQSLQYGLVFPEQHLDTEFFLSLSDQFSITSQVQLGTVNYVIKQKPQCADTNGNLAQVQEQTSATSTIFVCPSGFTMRPSLCPYLSKEPVIPSKYASSTPPFHDPNITFTYGQLTKFGPAGPPITIGNHPAELWNVDLAVPCFTGQCSQDWPSFVHSLNPNADPNLYTANPADHGKIFGCDLWVEVTSIL